MTCKDVIGLLCDYLDVTLSSGAAEELERHLDNCPACVAYLNTYKRTQELTQRTGRVEMPEEMKSRLRRFLLDQLASGSP